VAMGLFNNKKDKEFMRELKVIANDFDHVIDALDPDGNETITSRAKEHYLERLPDDAGVSASDFYIVQYYLIMEQLTLESLIDTNTSLAMFKKTREFFLDNPKYNTDGAIQLMQKWKMILAEMGVLLTDSGGSITMKTR
jgi:hypothetical protein